MSTDQFRVLSAIVAVIALCGPARAGSRFATGAQIAISAPAHLDVAIVVPTFALVQIGTTETTTSAGYQAVLVSAAGDAAPVPGQVEAHIVGNAGTLVIDAVGIPSPALGPGSITEASLSTGDTQPHPFANVSALNTNSVIESDGISEYRMAHSNVNDINFSTLSYIVASP
jgi:hypothetical protein